MSGQARPGTPATPATPARVTTLELFFDLVFVFTITQLTAVLTHEPDGLGLLRVVVMLGVIWWMYGGYAWLTNAVALDGLGRRGLLLGGMAAYLVVSLGIPHAFTDRASGLAFGGGYLLVVLVHTVLFTRSGGRGARGILRVAPFNLAAAVAVLVGGGIGGVTQYVLWAAAFLFNWCSHLVVPPRSRFDIEPAHFVERHGLVVIIAIGESVVAVGIGAGALPFTPAVAGLAVLGLALSACLWWAYFSGDDDRAESALAAASQDRPSLALRAFGLWHLPILLGIVGIAFGLETALAHPFGTAHLAPALGLGVGTAAFLVGDTLFRATLRFGDGRWRLAAAAVALATVPVGVLLAAAAQVAVLVVLLVATLATEAAVRRR